MDTPELLSSLAQAKTDFTAQGVAQVRTLLRALLPAPTPDPALLARLHELALFVRAYPGGASILELAERLLATVPDRIAALRAAGADLTPLEEPELSGIAGAGLSAVFSYPVARHLVERHSAQVRIEWDAYETPHRLGPVLSTPLPLLAEDAEVEPHPPYRAWLEAAAGKANPALWLLCNVADRRAYESLELPLRFDPPPCATRSFMRLPQAEFFYHRSPLIRRSSVHLDSIFTAAPLPVARLSRPEGAAMLTLARDNLAVRYRELHGFSWGDPSRVQLVEPGRGVQFYFSGVPPENRLPLRHYCGATIWKNGVPIGYFEGLSLCERMEAGFNLFYTFREGETAWIYTQLLQSCHQLYGVTCFSVDPYQIGLENEEAIQSGAFWFYRKLGYRSTDPELGRLTAREEKRLAAEPAYRSSPATLRRLVRRPMIYEGPGAERGAWDHFEVRNLGLAAAVHQPHRSRHPWDPLLERIPQLPRWSESNRKLLKRILQAKHAADETRYLRLTQRHAALRDALLRLGSPPAAA